MTKQSGWQISDTGPEAYERYIVPAWMGAWAQDLVKAGNVGPGKRVLDVACGTGIVARKAALLIGTCGRVTGLDINEGMIRSAKYFAEQDGIMSIEWQQGDAVCMPFEDADFDIVLCQQGLQFYPEPLTTLKEMARVMIPGGMLAISIWRELERYPCFKAFAQAIESLLGKEAAEPFHASCSLAGRPEIRALLSEAGFQNIHIRLEVKMARYLSIDEFIFGYLAATPLADKVSNLNEQDRLELFYQISKALFDYIDDDGLAAPMECHIVTANK